MWEQRLRTHIPNRGFSGLNRLWAVLLVVFLSANWVTPLFATAAQRSTVAARMACCKKGQVHACCKRSAQKADGPAIAAAPQCGTRCSIPFGSLVRVVSVTSLELSSSAFCLVEVSFSPVPQAVTVYSSAFASQLRQRPPPLT